MKNVKFERDYPLEDTESYISGMMAEWSSHKLHIAGSKWTVYDYDGEVKYEITLDIDYKDLDSRLKFEDLKLEVMYNIESLGDETTYDEVMIERDFVRKKREPLNYFDTWIKKEEY